MGHAINSSYKPKQFVEVHAAILYIFHRETSLSYHIWLAAVFNLNIDLQNLASHYDYWPLETSSSIQLLVISPSLKYEPIICQFRHQDLDTQPEFEALSYILGRIPYTHSIDCDGRTMSSISCLY
jgi:hypothetical protein